jgi:hypothetical protein
LNDAALALAEAFATGTWVGALKGPRIGSGLLGSPVASSNDRSLSSASSLLVDVREEDAALEMAVVEGANRLVKEGRGFEL